MKAHPVNPVHPVKTPWPTVRLGEVLTPTVRGESVDASKEYRLLGIRLDGQGPFLRETVMGTQTSATKLFHVAENDFIYSRLFACRGAFGVISKELDSCFVSGEFPAFIPVPGKIDVEYLKYWFRLPSVIATVDADCSGSTPLTRNRFKENFFLALEIPLPPLAEQRRVVARIEELAAQIHEARTLRHQAVEEAEALLPGAAESRLSDSFSRVRLEEVCPVITDGTHQTPRYTEDGAIFLSAKNVKPFRFMPEEHRKVSLEDFRGYTARNKPQFGDVLLTRVGAGIGEAAVIDQDIEFAIYVSLALIRTDRTRLSPEFLVHWLNSPVGRASSHRETLGRGTSQGNLNLKLLRGFLLPVPSLPEQRRIVSELDALQTEVDALKRLQAETATELGALLPAILDKAFKGEL
jgi:type I restriction enzyme S subunit